MRMRQYIHSRQGLWRYIHRTGMVHKDKGPHHPAQPEWQYPTYIQPMTYGSFTGFYYNIQHSFVIDFKGSYSAYPFPLYAFLPGGGWALLKLMYRVSTGEI